MRFLVIAFCALSAFSAQAYFHPKDTGRPVPTPPQACINNHDYFCVTQGAYIDFSTYGSSEIWTQQRANDQCYGVYGSLSEDCYPAGCYRCY